MEAQKSKMEGQRSNREFTGSKMEPKGFLWYSRLTKEEPTISKLKPKVQKWSWQGPTLSTKGQMEAHKQKMELTGFKREPKEFLRYPRWTRKKEPKIKTMR